MYLHDTFKDISKEFHRYLEQFDIIIILIDGGQGLLSHVITTQPRILTHRFISTALSLAVDSTNPLLTFQNYNFDETGFELLGAYP